MTSSRDWTEAELDHLMNERALADDALAEALRRTPGAVATMRAALHDYHRSSERTFADTAISRRLRERLEQRRGQCVCPQCDTAF